MRRSAVYSRISSRVTAAVIAGGLVVGSIAATSPAFADEATVTTTVSGYVQALSGRLDTRGGEAASVLRVPGQGYLPVDYSAVNLSDAFTGKSTVTVEVPASVDLGSSASEKFDALADLDASLTAVDVATKTSGPEARVNVSPVISSTHSVFAVLVTPGNIANTAPDSSQTAESAAANVAYSSSYWSSQSTGKVKFNLAAVVPWYKSATSCDVEDDANATNLWNEAYDKAELLGFEGAYNEHLVLIFPAGSDDECGALGLGTVGYTANEGGALWTVGGEDIYDKATLTHELGHNLSLGHASWLPTMNSATVAYGDGVDVMGFGAQGLGGGALSSAHAIRSGLWSTSAYSVAPQGTKSYTLEPVSGNSGKRAVEVVTQNGYSVFVEFRNRTGEDKGYDTVNYCNDEVCFADKTGVRILILQPNIFGDGDNTYSVNGYPGDDSMLVGRELSTPASENRTHTSTFLKGQTFSFDGVKIKVSSISSGSAKVSVTKKTPYAVSPYVEVERVIGYDDQLRAGDVLQANLDLGWVADSLTFQWQRSGKNISGAKKQSYTLVAADLGKSIRVKVTAKQKGYKTYTTYGGVDGTPIAGILDQGTVSIARSGKSLEAKTSGWTTLKTSFTYQWLRNGEAIKKATASTYTPTSADLTKDVSVKVVAKKSGYNTLEATSAPVSVTISVLGSATISGDVRVGSLLTLNEPSYSTNSDVILTRKFQWYNSGKAIKGATSATYTPVAADLKKVLTAKVTVTAPGHVAASATVATAKVAAGKFSGEPFVWTGQTDSTLSSYVEGVNETKTTKTYQWYRDDVKISKATKSTYKLTSTDNGKYLTVKVTLKKTAYETTTLTSVPRLIGAP